MTPTLIILICASGLAYLLFAMQPKQILSKIDFLLPTSCVVCNAFWYSFLPYMVMAVYQSNAMTLLYALPTAAIAVVLYKLFN